MSQSSVDIDGVLLSCLKQIVEPKAAKDKKNKKKRTNISSDSGLVPKALVQDTPHVLVKAWKAGEIQAKGTAVDYSSNRGKAYLKSLLNGRILTSVPLQLFLSDKETVRHLPGQIILNAAIYDALLGSKTCHGPPCIFLYMSSSNCQAVKDHLGDKLWFNGFGCVDLKLPNKLYGSLALAPFVPLGRAPFVIVTASSNKKGCQQMDEGGRALLERVKTWELLEAEKSMLHILICKKDSILENAAEEEKRRWN